MKETPLQAPIEHYRHLALAYFDAGDISAFSEMVGAVQREYRETPEAKLLQGILLYSQSLWGAETLLRDYVEICPKDFQGQRFLARILEERGDAVVAEQNFDEAQECFGEAIQHYLEATRLNPRDISSYNNLGYILMNHYDRPDLVTHCFVKALEIEPDDPQLNYNYGAFRLRTGIADEETLEHLQKAWKADHTFFEAGYGVFNFYVRTQNHWAAMGIAKEVRASARLSAEDNADPGQAETARNVIADIDEKMSILRRRTTAGNDAPPASEPDPIIV